MKLSIITVNLNHRDGLKKTIDSVVSQTFKDFEWIVIDGGSTDGSRELIEEYADHFVYWCSEPDKGIYHAMNKGILKATGEYIQFLNSGDRLFENSTLDKVCKGLDGDIVYGNAFFDEYGEVGKIYCYPEIMSLHFLYYSFICHQSTFFKLSLFDNRLYDENLSIVSDWEFYVRMLFENRSFKYIPVTVCYFEGNGESSKDCDLLNRERSYVIDKYYPEAYKEDFRMISSAESHLAHLHLNDFSALCESHKFLAKLITSLLLIMKRLGK